MNKGLVLNIDFDMRSMSSRRDWCLIAEQPTPTPHLAHSEECAALRLVLVTVPRGSRSCENFLDGFDLHLLHLIQESHSSTSSQDQPASPDH